MQIKRQKQPTKIQKAALKRCSLVSLLILVLTSCGFHLRGSNTQFQLTGQSVVIISESPFGEFEKIFKRELVDGGGLVVNEPVNNALMVKLIALDFQQQGASRDVTGRANEVILRATLQYQLLPSVQLKKSLLKEAHTKEADTKDTHTKEAHTKSVQVKGNEIENSEVFNVIKTNKSFYWDYRNPVGNQNQLKQTRESLYFDLSRRLLRQLQHYSATL